MAEIDKTVFISYRRNVSGFIARSIFMDLRNHGFDAFMDVESIDSGAFGTIIFNQIAARVHFLVILAPGTVERFAEPDDWMRREIEHALDLERNIVPVFVNQFSIDDKTIPYLSGKLERLRFLNGVVLPFDYFDEGMDRLRSRFLKMPVGLDVKPAPEADNVLIDRKIEKIAREEKPTKRQLSAEEYVNQAYQKSLGGDDDQAIADLNQAIKLYPKYVRAMMYRGGIYFRQGKYYEALEDTDHAIELNPQLSQAYSCRGLAYENLGQNRRAKIDFDIAKEIESNKKISF